MKPSICCPTCGETNPKAFAKHKGRHNGLQGYCRPCHSLYKKAYYGKNYYARYNLTLEQYDELLEKQKGVCAICYLPSELALSVDHDHACCPKNKSCGLCIRGLLCLRCNLLLGSVKDDSSILERAQLYLSTSIKKLL